MRVKPFFAIPLFLGVAALPSNSQQSTAVTQNSQAVTLLQASLTNMAVSAPSDSLATGTIEIVAGSQTSNGTIRILTKGTSESYVQLTTPSNVDSIIYSNNQANEVSEGVTSALSLERTQTGQAVEFPFAFISGLLANPDVSFAFVGAESLNGEAVNHLRTVDTYASQSQLQGLSALSTHDIWLDANTNLPVRISCVRHDAEGTAGVGWDVYFSNYQKSQGVAYPMTIAESLNGTPWATITIETITFNNGLTDAAFPIQQTGTSQ